MSHKRCVLQVKKIYNPLSSRIYGLKFLFSKILGARTRNFPTKLKQSNVSGFSFVLFQMLPNQEQNISCRVKICKKGSESCGKKSCPENAIYNFSPFGYWRFIRNVKNKQKTTELVFYYKFFTEIQHLWMIWSWQDCFHFC